MDAAHELESALAQAYSIERELGGGGMSRVFLAEERALGRKVVIKVLPRELAAHVSIERFQREIRVSARLQHPNIIPLLSAGDVNGLPYYTMPFVEGESLRAKLATGEPMPLVDALRVVREVAAALAHAHAKGVLHRDLKPGNVLLSGTSAMVADFGLAKALGASSADGESSISELGARIGTPEYMAPEQWSGEKNLDGRADIYALGVVAYEMLTGRTPFDAGAPAAGDVERWDEVEQRIEDARPDLREDVAPLLMRCLAKNRDDRPTSVGEVITALDLLAEPLDSDAARGARFRRRASGSAPVQSRRSRKWIAAAAIAVAAVAIYAIAGRPRPPAAQPIVRAGPSVAVLPFGNARGDSSDDYFSDGMAVDLTAALSKIGGLSVLAPKSAFAFKHGSLTAREIGESLHVSHVLEGTLSRSGNSLRVVPALVDVKTGVAVWSDVYDRESKDVFQVQDDITRAIVQQLRLKLDSAVRTPGSAAARLQAYDLYMRGRFEAAKVTRDGLDRGLRLLQRAVKLDSQSAVSWAGIAGIWNFLADDWVPPRIAYARSAEAASKATQIDSTLAEGHAELGAVKMWSAWDAAAADAEFRRAIAIDPNNLETRIYRGTLFLYRRMPDSALVESQRAQALDPLNASVTILECEALQDLKKWDAAEEKCRSAVKIDESNGETSLSMAAILITRGKLDEAERWASRETSNAVRSSVLLAHLQISRNHPDSARAMIRKIEEHAATAYVRGDYIGALYFRLGDIADGVRCYERALAERSASLMAFGTGSARERAFGALGPAVRADPRVAALVKRISAARRGL
jgi:serine/threonine-protein kinase